MNAGNGNLGWIANFIWGIADDVLRDMIFPMTVIRRLNAVLDSNKKSVLYMKIRLYEDIINKMVHIITIMLNSILQYLEQVPLQDWGGIEAFLRQEVLPYARDAWYDSASVKTCYKSSFTPCFYKPKPMMAL
jgi:hypothetical protein